MNHFIRFFPLIFLILNLGFSVTAEAASKTKNRKVEFISEESIMQAAKELGAFDHKLVLAVVRIESGKNRFAYNGRDRDGLGTYGLMQLKLATARGMGFKGKYLDLYEWRTNLKYGIRYLNYQFTRYGTVPSALAAYNAGSVFICKKGSKRKCTPGTFVNQSYVRSVLYHYRSIIDQDNGRDQKSQLIASETRKK